MEQYPKRLIEVDLPIKRISAHARREKSIRHGHISTLHIWWARRPLAACRAVICASLWPDPADELCPQSFRDAATKAINAFAQKAMTDKKIGENASELAMGRWNTLTKRPLESTNQEHWNILRYALLDFIADFSNWDNSVNRTYLETSRILTLSSYVTSGGFAEGRPLIFEPFAGGGAIPVEALRVGADVFASDLYDMPVFINKLMLEGLAGSSPQLENDYQYWADRLKASVREKLSNFFPVENNTEQPFAYFWSRTIECEGPSCGRIVPLIGNPILYKRKNDGLSIAIEYPINQISPKVIFVKPNDKRVRRTVKGGAATCVCGYTTPVTSVRKQLIQRNGGADSSMMLAVGKLIDGKKHYFLPSADDLDAVKLAQRYKEAIILNNNKEAEYSPFPDEKLWGKAKMNVGLYGMDTWENIFTARQLIQLRTFQETLQEMTTNEEVPKIIQQLLAITINKLVDYGTSLCRWVPRGEFIAATLGGEKKLPMMWDFSEVVLYGDGPGSWKSMVGWVGRVIKHFVESNLVKGNVSQSDARVATLPNDSVQAIITDPPYYDAIWYGDLSDMFSVWLRRTLRMLGVDSNYDVVAAKNAELIKSTFSLKDGLQEKNDDFYEDGMAEAFFSMRKVLQDSGIAVIVFAHKSTAGWETILSALIRAGWIITSSWPIDTEREARMTSIDQAALASSIHLVCRPRISETIGDWREILQQLPNRIQLWLPRLAQEGVVGADAIFACLGPALEIFSRYVRVEKASGEIITLGDYLEYVWGAVSREALNMVFAGADTTGFEEDSRLTAIWLWTLSTDETDSDSGKVVASTGYTLEYDAARKISQGLGAHLEQLDHLVEVSGSKARLLPVAERTRYLFGKDGLNTRSQKRKPESGAKQLSLLEQLPDEAAAEWRLSEEAIIQNGKTMLDRVHQAMLLFAAGRSDALKSFLVTAGVGQDEGFWRLANALSALYPAVTDEKRWVDGVLARKKGLGF